MPISFSKNSVTITIKCSGTTTDPSDAKESVEKQPPRKKTCRTTIAPVEVSMEYVNVTPMLPHSNSETLIFITNKTQDRRYNYSWQTYESFCNREIGVSWRCYGKMQILGGKRVI